MEQFKKHGVYEKVKEEVCWAVTGKGPIGTRWIDLNKGDEDYPDHRSRLVAQQVKYQSKEKNICGHATARGIPTKTKLNVRLSRAQRTTATPPLKTSPTKPN